MAADPTRHILELASGRNEITAPFHHTLARRKPSEPARSEPEAAPATELREQPSSANVAPIERSSDARGIVVATYTVAAAKSAIRPAPIIARTDIPRPPWGVFVGALAAVAGIVWWIMFQRLPDIDPQEVIARNLSAAETAMAEGRYSAPPETSALHYYRAVLAIDPDSAEANVGIDAVADRHVTNARALLAKGKLADAGLALEHARRARPEHRGLAVLDAQLRLELKQLLAAPTAPAAAQPQRPMEQVAKQASGSSRPVQAPPIARSPDPAPAASHAPDSQAKLASRAPASQPPGTAAKSTQSVAQSKPAPLTQSVRSTPQGMTLSAATDSGSPPATGEKSTATAERLAAISQQPVEDPSGPAVAEPMQDAASKAGAAPSLPPKLVKVVKPQYPQDALIRGLEGWVDISIEVNAAGDVVDSRVQDSSRGRLFNRAAIAAVQQWKYEPRPADTQSERFVVRLAFRLD